MKDRVVIFGNGTLLKNFLNELKPEDYIIGVDGAAYWLIQSGRIPDAAIGDFDSTTKKEYQLIKKSARLVKRYSKDKNWTDMELAIKHANNLHPKEVCIFGATGTRLDHVLATLHLLNKHILIDKNNRVRLIGRGKTIIQRSSYRYISVLPYTKSITISLSGFKYNLTQKILTKESSLGVSNEIAGKQGVIHMFSGRAWIIESKD